MTNEQAIEGLYDLMGLVTILEMKGKIPRPITQEIINEYRAAVQHAVMMLERD